MEIKLIASLIANSVGIIFIVVASIFKYLRVYSEVIHSENENSKSAKHEMHFYNIGMALFISGILLIVTSSGIWGIFKMKEYLPSISLSILSNIFAQNK